MSIYLYIDIYIKIDGKCKTDQYSATSLQIFAIVEEIDIECSSDSIFDNERM